jgi:hypothetical protein
MKQVGGVTYLPRRRWQSHRQPGYDSACEDQDVALGHRDYDPTQDER